MRMGSPRRRVAHGRAGQDPGQGLRREQGRPGESRSRHLGQSGPGGARSGRSLRRTRKASAADRSQYVWLGSRARHGLGDRGHVALRIVIESPTDGRRRRNPCARLAQPGRWPPSVGAIARHASERAGLVRPGMGAKERPRLTMRVSMGGRSTAWVGGILSGGGDIAAMSKAGPEIVLCCIISRLCDGVPSARRVAARQSRREG